MSIHACVWVKNFRAAKEKLWQNAHTVVVLPMNSHYAIHYEQIQRNISKRKVNKTCYTMPYNKFASTLPLNIYVAEPKIHQKWKLSVTHAKQETHASETGKRYTRFVQRFPGNTNRQLWKIHRQWKRKQREVPTQISHCCCWGWCWYWWRCLHTGMPKYVTVGIMDFGLSHRKQGLSK